MSNEDNKKQMVKINGVHGKTLIVEPEVHKMLKRILVEEEKKSMNEVIKELLQAKGKVFKVQHSHNHAQHDH
jgi:predicted CopG family antitoxin